MQPVSIDSDFNTDVAAESWRSTGSGSICGSGSGSGKPHAYCVSIICAQ